MRKDNVLGFLGILFRGHKALIGMEARESNKGKMAFLAFDASENSKKDVNALLEGIPVNKRYSKIELGEALGYPEVSFILIIDKKAAASLEEKEKETI